MEKKLTISHFTDPLCFWCYAMEPEVRKIRVLLDDQLDYHIVMGVLSADVREIIGFDKYADLRFEFIRNMLADHLTQAANAIGMPIASEGLFTHGPEDMVSLPLSMAYCAVRMIDEGAAEAYLRRMRESVFAEGLSLANVDEQAKLAGELSIDEERFHSSLESDETAALLQEGIDECKKYGVSAFPTLLLEYGENRIAVQGYHNYNELKQAIAQATDGQITLSDAEYSVHALESYVDRWGKVAAREIQTMFSLDDTQLANAMMDLVSTGRYKTENCGSSYFAMPK